MTTNPNTIPEPTAPHVVVRGTRDGKTAWAVRQLAGKNRWTFHGVVRYEGLKWSVLLSLFDAAPTIIDWASRIDRDKLAEVIDMALQEWPDGDLSGTDHDAVADAALAALPELMGGEQA